MNTTLFLVISFSHPISVTRRGRSCFVCKKAPYGSGLASVPQSPLRVKNWFLVNSYYSLM